MWEALIDISHNMEDPWCVLGDFNSVLHQGERMGGNDANEREMREFGDCILQCGLQEFKYVGPFTMAYGLTCLISHMLLTKPTVYQITLLLWLTFLFAQDQKRHLCSVICGPKMPNLLKLLCLS